MSPFLILVAALERYLETTATECYCDDTYTCFDCQVKELKDRARRMGSHDPED